MGPRDEGTARPDGSTGDRPGEDGGVVADDVTGGPEATGPQPVATRPPGDPATLPSFPLYPPYPGQPVDSGWARPGPAGPGYPGYPGPWGPPVYPGPSGPPTYAGPWGPPPAWGPPPGPPPQQPARRTHRWGLGAYLVVEAVFLLVSVGVAALLGDLLSSSAGALAIALVVPTLLAAGTALLITWWRGNGPRIDLGLQFSWRDVGIGLAFGFGGLVITIPASLLYVAIAGEDTTSAVGETFGGIRSGPWLAALVFVIVVFVAPLCEEIVYRGLLWGAVERLGANRWWAAAITTIVFALAHFEFTRTPLLLVVAVPIALARLYTGRLTAGYVAHAVNNLLPGISLALMLLGVLPGT